LYNLIANANLQRNFLENKQIEYDSAPNGNWKSICEKPEWTEIPNTLSFSTKINFVIEKRIENLYGMRELCEFKQKVTTKACLLKTELACVPGRKL